MSDTHVPIRPNDEDAHSHHHAVLHQRVLEGKGLLIAGKNIKISITESGAPRIDAIVPPSSTAGGGGLNNRGEYDPTSTYALNDLVVISMGINQGTFVCITPIVSGVPPYTGGGDWQQLPGGVLGVWF